MVAVAQETPNHQRYSVMRVGALRALCKEKGLPSDGRKEDLVNRLCNNCSSSYSGLINASTPSIIGGPAAGPAATSKPSTDVTTSDGVLSEGGITTSHESTGEGDGSSSSRLTTTELHELASIADEIRHIRKQTEFSLLRVAGLITDYPPSCLASDSRYGGVPKSTPYGLLLQERPSRCTTLSNKTNIGHTNGSWAWELVSAPSASDGFHADYEPVVKSLFREYSRGNIRLTHCPNCGAIADKYIELEIQLVFVDLILHRSQAYRHILFNRGTIRVHKEVYKFLTVMFALDSFDQWFLCSRSKEADYLESRSDGSERYPWEEFARWLQPHEHQWMLLIEAVMETVVYLAVICWLTRLYVTLLQDRKIPDPSKPSQHDMMELSPRTRAQSLRTPLPSWGTSWMQFRFLISAVVISCFGKLGVLLWMIWDASRLIRKAISVFTLTSNIVAVRVFLRCDSYTPPVTIVGLAFAARCAMSTLEPTLEFSII
ncbi:sterol homeostasis protein [Perkinsus olseni]|nr:sterol homeostasis protein [Perkinsus olseni]